MPFSFDDVMHHRDVNRWKTEKIHEFARTLDYTQLPGAWEAQPLVWKSPFSYLLHVTCRGS